MKIKNTFMLNILIIIALIIVAGCSTIPEPIPSPDTDTTTPQPVNDKPGDDTPSVKMPETQYPLSVTDDLNRKITIDKMPQRIVSLAPSITETLFALGLENRIVGVTDYCDYPEAAKFKPRVSSYTTPNTEKLISIEPDIIFAESIHEKTVVPALEKLDLKVIVLSATSIDIVLDDIILIGKITNVNQRADELANSMISQISKITDKTNQISETSKPGILYIIWHEPIWTMGRNTFIDDLFSYAGGKNIFASEFEKSRIVSLESIVSANPQIVIVSGMGTTGDTIFEAIKKEQRLITTDAFINNRIYKISDSNIIERPGPRIVEGLEELSKLIHPEIFGHFK